MIYFDNAATTFQKPPEVRQAVFRAMEHCASPGRGGYSAAMRASELVYECRCACGSLFDCNPEQVVFTSNATHGLNLAIKDLVSKGDRVVVSGMEHNAVMRPLCAIGADVVSAGTRLFAPELTAAAFRAAIRPGTSAVICTHVSNVFGYVMPLEEIAAVCREREVPLIVDAAQSAGILPLSLSKLGAAYLAVPGHKGLYGPQGTGVLLCGRTPTHTLMEGGTGSLSEDLQMPEFLPDRLEAGTMNVPGIAGLREGIRFVQRIGLHCIRAWEEELASCLADGLEQIPGIRVFRGECQSGVVSFCIEGMDCEVVAEALAGYGIAVRAGLHCAPSAHRLAGTLKTGTVRASFSVFNRKREVASFLRAIELVKKEK